MYIKPPGHKTESVPWMRLPWHPQINSFPVILCVLLNMTSFAYIQSNDIIYFHDCGKCCYAQIPFCPLPLTHKRQFPRICQTKHCFSIGWQPCLSQTSTSSGCLDDRFTSNRKLPWCCCPTPASSCAHIHSRIQSGREFPIGTSPSCESRDPRGRTTSRRRKSLLP